MENILTAVKKAVRRIFIPTPSDKQKNVLLIESALGETRVAHMQNGILEHFETEMWDMRPEKGNIYRAKIARIESSLQAVFVDYGNKKQGFLPFSELHPDYFEDLPCYNDMVKEISDSQNGSSNYAKRDILKKFDLNGLKDKSILVQIIKDVRGSKGAALTTFLALRGRHVILMPNSPGTLGVSKKIEKEEDRSTIKDVLNSLSLTEGMGLIARSSCLGKKRSDIRRDYDYTMRLWKKIQKKDKKDVGLVYEEQGLLVRTLRDVYHPDMDAVIINEEESYKMARQFMRSFTPKGLKKLRFLETPALFSTFDLQDQIDSIDQNVVELVSGGSIVIDPTEALVSIDVNSAKSRQYRSAEETALQTNVEAAKEVARQLRLRGLAGLVVIDFIDMHASKRSIIEKILKEECEKDSAVTCIGPMSDFGLIEMSRQRMRQSFSERRTKVCQVCNGSGRTLLPAIAVSQILRALEEMLFRKGTASRASIYASTQLILCFLNRYCSFVQDIERRYKMTLFFEVEDGQGDIYCRIDIPEHSVSHLVWGSKEKSALLNDDKLEGKAQSNREKNNDQMQKKSFEKKNSSLDQEDASIESRGDGEDDESQKNSDVKAKSRKKRSPVSKNKKTNKQEVDLMASDKDSVNNKINVTQEEVSERHSDERPVEKQKKDRHKKNLEKNMPNKVSEKEDYAQESKTFSIVLPPPKKKNPS